MTNARTRIQTPITARTSLLDMSLPLTTLSAGPQPMERSPALTTDASGTEEARPTANEMAVASMGRVHDAGKCEALLDLAKLLKSKFDKKDLSPQLQSLLAEPAIDADYLFAFKGESKRPDDLKNNDRNNDRVKPTENGENRDASLVETGIDEDEDDERDGHPTEALITSLTQHLGALFGRCNYCPRYDKRKRMRALVNGAVDDARTRLRLDTGANVSVTSASFAKRLRTRRRALVKITLGWEQADEFEMWIIDHSAGVDVVLGMDFMIPTGIRLDRFHGTARLPDEVMVPLPKPQSVGDDEPYGTQPSCGPIEDLYVPGREWQEFRLPRQRQLRSEYDVWVRRTGKLVPTCPKHDSVVLWVPHGELPRETGYARLSQGSAKVIEPGADDTERDGITNDGSDDEASARTDSDALEGSSLHRASYTSKRTDHNAYSIEHGAQEAPAEVSGAGAKRDDGVGELNDDSGEDHDAPDVTAAAESAPRMAGTATDTKARPEPDQTSVAWGNATIDWGEHDPGSNDILTEAGTATTEVSTDGENCVDGPDKEDPERLLEANYTSVVHAMVAEGFPEDDDTANEIYLSDYAQDGGLAKVWKWNGPEMTYLSADEHRSIVRLGDDLHEWRTQHDGYPARDGRRMKLLETMIELPSRWSGMSASINTPADETNKDEAQGRVTEDSSADINVEKGRACAPDLDLRRCMDLMMKLRYEWIWDRYARQLRFVQGGGA
ncbi:hypothetical protein PHYSODRAFT_334612 [Phytophthora sojae]|uniref:Peptidase A2 domain-containing protein n=1 Tax=Phytophthora sojae (strain P6497) TaxID=1094619 RepID=G4ZKQ4_PHYSP|nr:hypothetical protein PHYSODRAFT_334612 [Phytophthora sojae]EGZ16424.1 hypothetical protein PHYSODRAFT_334612 [Phytophthora sojae]|eukprot:XP_009530173.1 hypothetical protein PHYSODRAFT_334612 [Phytophthora sojae]